MDENFSTHKTINDEIPHPSSGTYAESVITQPKPRRKMKELPPPRVQQSRSCSSLCKRQPSSYASINMHETDTSDLNELSKQTEEDDDIDVAGNELINMINEKFKLSSPKLIIGDGSSNNQSTAETSHERSLAKEINDIDMEQQFSMSSTPNKPNLQLQTVITTVMNSLTSRFEEMMTKQQEFQQQQHEKMMEFQQNMQKQYLQLHHQKKSACTAGTNYSI